MIHASVERRVGDMVQRMIGHGFLSSGALATLIVERIKPTEGIAARFASSTGMGKRIFRWRSNGYTHSTRARPGQRDPFTNRSGQRQQNISQSGRFRPCAKARDRAWQRVGSGCKKNIGGAPGAICRQEPPVIILDAAYEAPQPRYPRIHPRASFDMEMPSDFALAFMRSKSTRAIQDRAWVPHFPLSTTSISSKSATGFGNMLASPSLYANSQTLSNIPEDFPSLRHLSSNCFFSSAVTGAVKQLSAPSPGA